MVKLQGVQPEGPTARLVGWLNQRHLKNMLVKLEILPEVRGEIQNLKKNYLSCQCLDEHFVTLVSSP